MRQFDHVTVHGIKILILGRSTWLQRKLLASRTEKKKIFQAALVIVHACVGGCNAVRPEAMVTDELASVSTIL